LERQADALQRLQVIENRQLLPALTEKLKKTLSTALLLYKTQIYKPQKNAA